MLELDSIQKRLRDALQQRVRWVVRDTTIDFDFSRLLEPLAPLQDFEIDGPIEPEWRSLFLFGQQDVAEGGGASPFLGIDIHTGAVHGLDLERDPDCVFLLNSSVDAFLETFALFDDVLRQGTVPLESVDSRARTIDPAFSTTEWSDFLDFLLDR